MANSVYVRKTSQKYRRVDPVRIQITLFHVQLLTNSLDGDLGSSKSNLPLKGLCILTHSEDEILLSREKTIAVIDGSGVLADPSGINHEELVRLAKLRVPVGNFDLTKLSKDGYLVRVEDHDVKLPCMWL